MHKHTHRTPDTHMLSFSLSHPLLFPTNLHPSRVVFPTFPLEPSPFPMLPFPLPHPSSFPHQNLPPFPCCLSHFPTPQIGPTITARTQVCIRCSLTIAAIEQPSSSQHSISKKRKTTASFQLRSSDTQFPDTTVSPEASVSSTGTVVSGDFCSDRSCCSSSHFKDLHSVPSDLQVRSSKF